MVEVKTCNACGETKPLADFWYRNGESDQPCLDCHSASFKRYAKENPEKLRESRARANKKRREKGGGVKERAWGAVFDSVRRRGKQRAKDLSCAHCGAPAAMFDHHKGYEGDSAKDVVPVCLECNNALRYIRGEFKGEFRRPLPTKVKDRIALYPSLVGGVK